MLFSNGNKTNVITFRFPLNFKKTNSKQEFISSHILKTSVSFHCENECSVSSRTDHRAHNQNRSSCPQSEQIIARLLCPQSEQIIVPTIRTDHCVHNQNRSLCPQSEQIIVPTIRTDHCAHNQNRSLCPQSEQIIVPTIRTDHCAHNQNNTVHELFLFTLKEKLSAQFK